MNTAETWDDLGAEVIAEVDRQYELWGEQNHPDGTALPGDNELAEDAKRLADMFANSGHLTWRDILQEEVREAFAESDPVTLREELVQVAAVAVSWVNAIDRRGQ
jgi:hypothetical protein